VPRDVSLVSRDDDPFLENFVPIVSRYHSDSGLFARKVSRLVLDLVRNGVPRQHDARLMPSFVRGETLV
jgi:DNA-binding LacI/PurR family transcriptional regulator